MPFFHTITIVSRVFITLLLVLSLTGCDYFSNLYTSIMGSSSTSKNVSNDSGEVIPLRMAVAKRVAWMPWHLAKQEGTFHQHVSQYKVDIDLVTDSDYSETIQKFVNGEVHAIAITNIDAIAQLVRQDVESDVILIMGYSKGNDAILLPADANTNIRGKKIGLLENSARHYLLDRFLTKNQINFDDVTVVNTLDADITRVFGNHEVYGVATDNPNLDKLAREQRAKVLFDSNIIPNEVTELIVVNRETLIDHPGFAQALLATWFSVMDRIRGNKRATTFDAIAQLAGTSREEYERQLGTLVLNDTPAKALSAIRDRSMRKTMRHVRYFIERHKLMEGSKDSDKSFAQWVSYPGRTPALLHFNGKPLQAFIL